MREAGELEAERGRLGVDAVRAADAQRVRVLARLLGERGGQLARARDDHLAGPPQLQRERRVEHVRGGQPEVDPAAGRTGRRREHVDERGHVVVGDRLALLDRLDREGRAADRLEVLVGRSVERLRGRHLDVAPGGHAGLVGPERAELRAGVAGDHARHRRGCPTGRRSSRNGPLGGPPAQQSRMRAASTAALRALSTPTQADRHARRHLGDREQRVEPAGDRLRRRQRHADHRQRRCGRRPRPAARPTARRRR